MSSEIDVKIAEAKCINAVGAHEATINHLRHEAALRNGDNHKLRAELAEAIEARDAVKQDWSVWQWLLFGGVMVGTSGMFFAISHFAGSLP